MTRIRLRSALLLREVLRHRIAAIHNGRYAFKGDNNHFRDPVHPTRAQLVGKLWVHSPDGGVVLNGLHSPVVDGALCALLGMFLSLGRRGEAPTPYATAGR